MFLVCAFINKFHLLHLRILYTLLLAFSDFVFEGMILILIATILGQMLIFYLSVHNSPLLTFISGFGRLVHGQKMAKDSRDRAKHACSF